MRKIKELLQKLGIYDEFIIGNGAKHPTSEIHFRIDRKSAKFAGEQYAIQFEQESQTIAMWDLRNRLALSASLNLYVQSDFMWNSIAKIYTRDVAIGKRNSGIVSKVAIMSFEQFESFLLFNKEFGFDLDLDNSDFKDDDYESIDIVGSTTEGKLIYYYGKRYE